MLYENIKKLVEYGIQTGLTPECERIYTTNLLLELFQEDSYEDVEIDSSSIELEAVLEGLLDEAVKRGIIMLTKKAFSRRTVWCIVTFSIRRS